MCGFFTGIYIYIYRADQVRRPDFCLGLDFCSKPLACVFNGLNLLKVYDRS